MIAISKVGGKRELFIGVRRNAIKFTRCYSMWGKFLKDTPAREKKAEEPEENVYSIPQIKAATAKSNFGIPRNSHKTLSMGVGQFMEPTYFNGYFPVSQDWTFTWRRVNLNVEEHLTKQNFKETLERAYTTYDPERTDSSKKSAEYAVYRLFQYVAVLINGKKWFGIDELENNQIALNRLLEVMLPVYVRSTFGLSSLIPDAESGNSKPSSLRERPAKQFNKHFAADNSPQKSSLMNPITWILKEIPLFEGAPYKINDETIWIFVLHYFTICAKVTDLFNMIEKLNAIREKIHGNSAEKGDKEEGSFMVKFASSLDINKHFDRVMIEGNTLVNLNALVFCIQVKSVQLQKGGMVDMKRKHAEAFAIIKCYLSRMETLSRMGKAPNCNQIMPELMRQMLEMIRNDPLSFSINNAQVRLYVQRLMLRNFDGRAFIGEPVEVAKPINQTTYTGVYSKLYQSPFPGSSFISVLDYEPGVQSIATSDMYPELLVLETLALVLSNLNSCFNEIQYLVIELFNHYQMLEYKANCSDDTNAQVKSINVREKISSHLADLYAELMLNRNENVSRIRELMSQMNQFGLLEHERILKAAEYLQGVMRDCEPGNPDWTIAKTVLTIYEMEKKQLIPPLVTTKAKGAGGEIFRNGYYDTELSEEDLYKQLVIKALEKLSVL